MAGSGTTPAPRAPPRSRRGRGRFVGASWWSPCTRPATPLRRRHPGKLLWGQPEPGVQLCGARLVPALAAAGRRGAPADPLRPRGSASSAGGAAGDRGRAAHHCRNSGHTHQQAHRRHHLRREALRQGQPHKRRWARARPDLYWITTDRSVVQPTKKHLQCTPVQVAYRVFNRGQSVRDGQFI